MSPRQGPLGDENQGFHDGKNRYGMEHIRYHEPNSLVVNWLLILLALVIERLCRVRYLCTDAAALCAGELPKLLSFAGGS